MKKIILFAFAILTSVNIFAENKVFEDENGLKYQYDDTANEPRTATLIDGKSVNKTKIDFILTDFTVDSKTYYVTSIGEEAFTTNEGNTYTGNQSIDYVIIPEGVL